MIGRPRSQAHPIDSKFPADIPETDRILRMRIQTARIGASGWGEEGEWRSHLHSSSCIAILQYILPRNTANGNRNFYDGFCFSFQAFFPFPSGAMDDAELTLTHQVWQGQLSLATFDIRQRIYPNQTWCWSKGLGSLVTRLWKEIEFSSKTLRVQQGKSERLLENGWTQTWQGRFVPWQDCLINTIHEAVIRSVLIATNI